MRGQRIRCQAWKCIRPPTRSARKSSGCWGRHQEELSANASMEPLCSLPARKARQRLARSVVRKRGGGRRGVRDREPLLPVPAVEVPLDEALRSSSEWSGVPRSTFRISLGLGSRSGTAGRAPSLGRTRTRVRGSSRCMISSSSCWLSRVPARRPPA